MSRIAFTLEISGMHCASCVRRVEKALTTLPSVQLQHVDVGHAEGSFDSELLDVAQLHNSVEKLGFGVVS